MQRKLTSYAQDPEAFDSIFGTITGDVPVIEAEQVTACEHDLLAAFPRNVDGTVNVDTLSVGIDWDTL